MCVCVWHDQGTVRSKCLQHATATHGKSLVVVYLEQILNGGLVNHPALAAKTFEGKGVDSIVALSFIHLLGKAGPVIGLNTVEPHLRSPLIGFRENRKLPLSAPLFVSNPAGSCGALGHTDRLGCARLMGQKTRGHGRCRVLSKNRGVAQLRHNKKLRMIGTATLFICRPCVVPVLTTTQLVKEHVIQLVLCGGIKGFVARWWTPQNGLRVASVSFWLPFK